MDIQKFLTTVGLVMMFLSMVGMVIVVACAVNNNGADLARREAEMDKLLGRKPRK